MRFVYFYCGVTASLLAFAMATNIVIIILLYQSREMPLQRSRFGRWSLLFVAIGTTAVFYIGGYELVKDVARNTLPNPPISPTATSASP